MNPKMKISLQRNSSWLADVSYQTFPSSSHQVNLLSGDGQSIFLPLSFLVASSSFLQSLLSTPCSCTTSPTISLPSTTGFTLAILSQIFSRGETEQLSGETVESCVKSVREVLDLLKSEVKVVLKLSNNNCVKNVQVVEVISLAHVVKEELEDSENCDVSLAFHEKVDAESRHVFSASLNHLQQTSQVGNLVSSLKASGQGKDPDREATSQATDKNNEILKCPFCERNFQKLSSLLAHKKIRHGEKKGKYKCKKCDLNYSCRKNLIRHNNVKHGNNSALVKNQISGRKEFQYSEGELEFFSTQRLVKHKSDRHLEDYETENKMVGEEEESEDPAVNKMRFRCTKCKSTFTRRSGLNLHIKRVHERIVFACGVCHKISGKTKVYKHCKEFCHDTSLIYEIKDRLGNVPNNSLLMERVAIKHKVGDGGEEGGREEDNKIRVEGGQCKKTFHDESTLPRHTKRIHEGVIYACGECDKFFPNKKKSVAHCKTIGHDEGLMYKIPIQKN